MITLPGYPRPHVVVARGVNGLPAAMLAGLGDTCYDTLGNAYDCDSSGDPTDGGGVVVSSPVTPVTAPPTCDSAFCSLTAAQQATFESLPASAQGAYLQSAGIPTNEWAQIIAAAGNAATSIARVVVGGQSVVPGTPVAGYTYNPATGQYTATAALSASASPLFIMGIVVAGVFLLFALKK